MNRHGCWRWLIRHIPRAVLVTVLAGDALVCAEESLAEAARREQEKRKAAPPPARTITNEDLAKYPEAPQSQRAARQEEDRDRASPQSQPFVWEEPDWGAMEIEWRMRFAAVRQRVAEAESRAWVDKIETVFYDGIPVQMRVRELVETEELRMAKQELDRLQEELRKAGLPPGWGRD